MINKNNVIKISKFILCSFLLSVLLLLPIFLVTIMLLAYLGVLLIHLNVIDKDTLIVYLPKISKILSSIISIYVGTSLSESIFKEE